MIPKSRIEREVCLNQYGDGEFYSSYMHHAEENFRFLKKVYNKEIPFVSSLYSMLSNTLELYYKGIISAYAEQNEMFVPDAIMLEHNLVLLDDYVDEKMFDIKSKDHFQEERDFLTILSRGYIRSRYDDVYEYHDFEKSFRRVEKQRELLFINYHKCLQAQLDSEQER